MPQLPVELIAQIVDYLPASEASLITRDSLHTARKTLFSSVFLSPPRCFAEVQFFHRSPHLCPYVRSLIIFWRRDDSPSPDTFPLLREVFPNAQRLSLASVPRLPWKDFPSCMMSSIQSILEPGTLRTLQLRWWRFSDDADELAGLLRSCSASLEVLSMQQMNISFQLEDVPSDTAFRIVMPTLTHLRLSSFRGFSCLGPHHISAPQLLTLSWSVSPRNVALLPQILCVADVSHLAALTVRLEFDSTGEGNPTSFRKSWDLSVSTLRLFLNYFDDPELSHDDIIQCIADCVGNIPSPESMERLCLVFPDVEEYPPVSAWSQVEARLVRLCRREGLQRVEVYPQSLDACLPVLQSMGVLSVVPPDTVLELKNM